MSKNRSTLSLALVLIAVLTLLAAAFGANAQQAAEPPVSASAVNRFSDFSEVEGATSKLTRFDNGITTTINTSDLKAGDVYTLWWVIFNDPQNCSGDVCNLDDIFVVDADGKIQHDDVGNRALNFDGITAANISVQHAGGNLTPDGSFSASASLGLGEVPGIVFGPGLLDSYKAEVHLVVRTHGPKVDAFFDDQISTFGGGCDPIDTAPCDDIQFAMHMPVVR